MGNGFIEPDFKTLFESAPGLYLVLDPGLRIVAASDAYLRATLTRRADILGQFVFDVFPDNPSDHSADAVGNSSASFHRVLQSRIADVMALQRHDVRKPESEGGGWETRYWSAINSPILNADGSVAYIMHRVENVTELALLQQQGVEQNRLADVLREQTAQVRAEMAERKRAEEALRESQEHLRLAVEAAELGTWDFDPLAGELNWSDRCKALSGLQPEARVTYRDFLERVHPSDRGRTDELVQQALDPNGSGKYENEYRTVWPDGTERWVAATGKALFETVGDQRRPIRFIGAVLDTTARKRAEEALRESEGRYRSLFANSLDAVVLTRADGAIEAANPAACAMFGMTEQEICRAGRDGLVDRNDGRLAAGLQGRAVNGRAQSELTFVLKDGSKFEGDVSSVAVGEKGRAFVIIRDITSRKKREEALHSSQEQLRQRVEELETVMDVAPVAIWVAHDPQCNAITGNRMANAFYEAAPDENVSRNISAVRRFFQDGRELEAGELPMQQAAALGKEVRGSELEVLLPSGRRIVMIGHASPLWDGHGRARGCVGAFLDITDRKAVLEQLRESESRLRSLGDNLPEGVLYRYCHDACGKPYFEFVSAGIEHLTGIPAAEFMANAAAIDKSIVPEDHERLRDAILASRDRLMQFELEVRRKHRLTGEIRWSLLRSTPTRNADGSTKWDGIELDITERKRAEEALRRSEALYRGIARNLPDGVVCIVDRELRCIGIEGALAARWGLERDKLEGRPVLEAVDADLRPVVEAHFRRALAGEAASYETDVRGRRVWSQYAPVREENGTVVGAMMLGLDISERERAEDRLRQAQKLESLGLLAGGVAHDFNNLLVGVIGNASLAQEMLPPDHPAAELVHGVLKTGEQAAHLTRQMLAYSGKGKFLWSR